jgi:hypothetical protein
MLMDKRASSTKWKHPWLLAACFFWSCPLVCAKTDPAVNLSRDQAFRIGRKIWQNECGGSVAGLTSWNEGENFASLGIGHFIWYPEGGRGPFEESFPNFMESIRNAGADVPVWLQHLGIRSSGFPACPWNSRAEFLRDQNSPRMKELRTFLARTVDLQTQFMVGRLQNSLAKMLGEAAPADRANVRQQFMRVAGAPQGCYALVDYVNFKGEGTLHSERYHDQGWGLLQVLEGMHGTTGGQSALEEFSRTAAAVLRRRVQNSLPTRNEARWLPGWINRINSYRQNS